MVNKDVPVNTGDFSGDMCTSCALLLPLATRPAPVKYKENGGYRLQPENDFMEPIITTDVTILGKVVGVYRKL